ncbi:SELENOK [Bugula neritina]|uniref:SELENOK n=1 Tax=Bugula neritina TaxID=10212 RepID=A0A7J7JYU0_BUGNE|nr:SELENOK [Bugula neritina]
MVYVSGGQVYDSRPWSLGSIQEIFWGFLNFIVLFFKTLVSPNLTSKGANSASTYRAGGSSGGGGPRGPPPGPKKRMGGFGGRGGGPSAPPMAGG